MNQRPANHMEMQKNGVSAEVHVSEVDLWTGDGWTLVDSLPERAEVGEPAPVEPVQDGIGTDSGDQFSDDQLRAAITDATGKAPHHKLGRERLIAEFNRLNAEASAPGDEADETPTENSEKNDAQLASE